MIFVKTVFLHCSAWSSPLGAHEGEVHVMVGIFVSDLRLQWGKFFSQPCSDGSIIVTELVFPSKHTVH